MDFYNNIFKPKKLITPQNLKLFNKQCTRPKATLNEFLRKDFAKFSIRRYLSKLCLNSAQRQILPTLFPSLSLSFGAIYRPTPNSSIFFSERAARDKAAEKSTVNQRKSSAQPWSRGKTERNKRNAEAESPARASAETGVRLKPTAVHIASSKVFVNRLSLSLSLSPAKYLLFRVLP